MAYWLFQGNPKYYRIIEGIRDFEQMPWLVTRYAKDIAPGDGVLVWVSGKEAGIYALAEVTEPTQVLSQLPDRKYWTDANRAVDKAQAMIRFTSKLLERLLLKTNLLQDPLRKNLPESDPGATAFRLCGCNRLRR